MEETNLIINWIYLSGIIALLLSLYFGLKASLSSFKRPMAKEITGLHSILGKLIFNLKDLSFSLEEFEKDKHEKKINEKLHYFRKKIKNREEEINELKMYDTQEYDKGVSKRNINALLMFVFGFIALVLQILNLAI